MAANQIGTGPIGIGPIGKVTGIGIAIGVLTATTCGVTVASFIDMSGLGAAFRCCVLVTIGDTMTVIAFSAFGLVACRSASGTND